MPPTRSGRPPRDLNFAGKYRRAGQADRTGSDRQRGIRHRCRTAPSSTASAPCSWCCSSSGWRCIRQDHLRGVRQSLHRPVDHHRRRADDGGFAQPALDRVRGSVRRTGRRFRHSVQRPLPLGALQEQRSADGAGTGRRICRGPAFARGDGDGGRVPLVPADRLQGRLGTRRDRRRRHAGGVSVQHHGAAGVARACSIRPAKRSRSAMRSWRRSIISSKSIASSSSSARCWSRSPACRCFIS